jgi:hypothetical protein
MMRITTAIFGLALALLCVALPATADEPHPEGRSGKNPPFPPVNIPPPRSERLGENPFDPLFPRTRPSLPLDIGSRITFPPAGRRLDWFPGMPALGSDVLRPLPEFDRIHDSGDLGFAGIEPRSRDRWVIDYDRAFTDDQESIVALVVFLLALTGCIVLWLHEKPVASQ